MKVEKTSLKLLKTTEDKTGAVSQNKSTFEHVVRPDFYDINKETTKNGTEKV